MSNAAMQEMMNAGAAGGAEGDPLAAGGGGTTWTHTIAELGKARVASAYQSMDPGQAWHIDVEGDAQEIAAAHQSMGQVLARSGSLKGKVVGSTRNATLSLGELFMTSLEPLSGRYFSFKVLVGKQTSAG